MILRFLICLLSLVFLSGTAHGATALPNPLKIVISNDSFPYMFADENGEPAGLVVDYWQELARQQQIQLQFTMADWAQTLSLLENKQVHVHGGIARTLDRERDYQMGDTGVKIYSNMFVQRDMPAINKLIELAPFAIGVVDQSSHVATIKQMLPGAMLKPYPTVTAMYQAALDGQIKVMAGLDRLPPRYDRYDELATQFPLYRKIPLRDISLSYAVLKDSVLFAALESATTQLEPAVLDLLERRWLGLPVDDNTLLLGLSVDNPPYMNVSLQGEAQGLFVDLWRHWSEISGQKIAFVPDTSFNNLQNLAKGRIDAVIGLPDNNMLPDNVVAAYQIYGFQSQYFTMQDSTFAPLTEMAQVKIGVFENAPYLSELRLRYPHAEFVRFRQLPEMLNAVIAKELSGFFAAAAIVPPSTACTKHSIPRKVSIAITSE